MLVTIKEFIFIYIALYFNVLFNFKYYFTFCAFIRLPIYGPRIINYEWLGSKFYRYILIPSFDISIELFLLLSEFFSAIDLCKILF